MSDEEEVWPEGLTDEEVQERIQSLREIWVESINNAGHVIAALSASRGAVPSERLVASIASATNFMLGAFAQYIDRDTLAEAVQSEAACLGLNCTHTTRALETLMVQSNFLSTVMNSEDMPEEIKQMFNMGNKDDDDDGPGWSADFFRLG